MRYIRGITLLQGHPLPVTTDQATLVLDDEKEGSAVAVALEKRNNKRGTVLAGKVSLFGRRGLEPKWIEGYSQVIVRVFIVLDVCYAALRTRSTF